MVLMFEKKIKAVKKRHKIPLIDLALILISFLLLNFIIFFIEPESIKNLILPNSYLIFFLVLFTFIYFTAHFIFSNTRRSLLISIILVIFLLLRLHGLGNWLNLILLIGLGTTIDYYFTKKT